MSFWGVISEAQCLRTEFLRTPTLVVRRDSIRVAQTTDKLGFPFDSIFCNGSVRLAVSDSSTKGLPVQFLSACFDFDLDSPRDFLLFQGFSRPAPGWWMHRCAPRAAVAENLAEFSDSAVTPRWTCPQ